MNYINKWDFKTVESHLNSTLKSNYNVIAYSSAGDGNMNYTYRISTKEKKNFIIKQAPPYCAKFPSIVAPEQRFFTEISYYSIGTQSSLVNTMSPQILGTDEKYKIFYMTDLGEGEDFGSLYNLNKPRLKEQELESLIKYMSSLHSITTDDTTKFKNIEMRELNYNYIFKLPFDNKRNDINLDEVTPGLQDVAQSFKENIEIRKEVENVGKNYWVNTKTLIHGDFYPRSWLKTNSGIAVIDPEFSFFGIAEFDLSVFLAHMAMCNSFNMPFISLKKYYGDFDEQLVAKLTAIEIFRRNLYIAQLPLHNTLHFKKELLDRSKEALLTGSMNSFFGAIEV